MQHSFLNAKLRWGIRTWQLIAFFCFYFFFALQYWLVLWYTSGGTYKPWVRVLIDYMLIKAALTLPLWILYFNIWKNKSLRFKILMHLFTGPLWVMSWFYMYHAVENIRGAGYLTGDGSGWDIYIPGLVYCIQFSIFHIYELYVDAEKRKEKEKELMQAAHNSEVNALKAQIQPHFLFNTLNSISASVPVEMEHTRELIAKLADTFRYSLKANQEESITLGEELAFTRATLELEQERFKKRLQVNYDVDESLLAVSCPPMLIQPLTENAIKHSIAPAVNGGTITITIKRLAEKINICVSDTGMGYHGQIDVSLFQKGVGLRNTSLRLAKIYGEKIVAEKNLPSGIKFSFNISYQQ